MNRQFLAAITAITSSLSVSYAQVQDIGSASGGDFLSAAISDDGSVVSGSARHPILGRKAAVWTEAGGLRLFDQSRLSDFYALDMSDNGRVIAGVQVTGANRTGAVWSAATGRRVDIPPLPRDTSSDVRAISGDGLTVVGTSYGSGHRAFRWSRTTGTQEVVLPANQFCRVFGVSDDGGVIVGSYDLAGGQSRAFVWTQATGAQLVPGLGDHDSYASDVSDDGQVIVGRTFAPGFTSRIFYYRAGAAAVPVSIGATTPAGPSIRVSGDGSTVVGTGNFASGKTGFVWTPGAGHVVLGSGATYSPVSVSADGAVVCGTVKPGSSGKAEGAFRWDSTGLMILDSIAPNELASAFTVSADGSSIAGYSVAASGELHGALWRKSGELGAEVCDPAVPNSTGVPGRLLLGGTNAIARGDLTLRAVDLPRGATTMFLVSRTTMAPTPIVSSQGLSCLGSTVGFFFGPGQIKAAGADGIAELSVDFAAFPFPVGAIVSGNSLSFQAWHRDSNPTATWNITSASTVQVF